MCVLPSGEVPGSTAAQLKALRLRYVVTQTHVALVSIAGQGPAAGPALANALPFM
jgi:hypothetical protein